MYLGRYQLGEVVPVVVQCRNRNQKPVRPDIAPLAAIYRLDSSGAVPVTSRYMSMREKSALTSFFQLDLFLNATLFVNGGQHVAIVTYTSEGADQVEEEFFEIVGGGNELGVVTGLHYWERPEARQLVMLTQLGTLRAGRNPS